MSREAHVRFCESVVVKSAALIDPACKVGTIASKLKPFMAKNFQHVLMQKIKCLNIWMFTIESIFILDLATQALYILKRKKSLS